MDADDVKKGPISLSKSQNKYCVYWIYGNPIMQN